jgi:hypothetical protein
MSSQSSRSFSGRQRYVHRLASLLQVLIMLALMAAAVVLLAQSVSAWDGRNVLPFTAEDRAIGE